MTSQDSNIDHRDDDLDWVAFCYVADELDAEARTSFEQRLATDTAACDAVARVIELSQMVCSAAESGVSETKDVSLEPESHLQSTERNRKRLPRFVFAASILLTLLAVGWAMRINLTSDSIAGLPSEDLAMTWADSLTQTGISNGNDDNEPNKLFSSDDLFSSEMDLTNDGLTSEDPELAELDFSDNWMLIAMAEMEATNQ